MRVEKGGIYESVFISPSYNKDWTQRKSDTNKGWKVSDTLKSRCAPESLIKLKLFLPSKIFLTKQANVMYLYHRASLPLINYSNHFANSRIFWVLLCSINYEIKWNHDILLKQGNFWIQEHRHPATRVAHYTGCPIVWMSPWLQSFSSSTVVDSFVLWGFSSWKEQHVIAVVINNSYFSKHLIIFLSHFWTGWVLVEDKCGYLSKNLLVAEKKWRTLMILTTSISISFLHKRV